MPQGSIISPSLFLLFLNDLLCLTTNPICSFADDSSLCHSYSYNAHPNLNEVGASRNYLYMDDILNSDLVKIEEWGRVNRVELNARKTQCCLLSHKRTSDPGLNVYMGGMARILMFWSHRYDLIFVGMIMFSMCRKKQPSV